MFSYTISKKASLKEFEQICILIEATFRNIKKAEVLEDVDGSLIQIYTTSNGEIKVYNDYDVDAVYIDSEQNLDLMFSLYS